MRFFFDLGKIFLPSSFFAWGHRCNLPRSNLNADFSCLSCY